MWQRRAGNKYNVAIKSERTALGRVFDSKAEMHQALEFEHLRKRGEILELEYQPVLVLLPKPNLVKYIPDFRVVWRNGHEEYVDVKGVETPVFKLKVKLVRHFHPEKRLIIVKALYVEEQETGTKGKEAKRKANHPKGSSGR